MKISSIPLSFPMTLSFGCVADQIVHLAIPRDFEIVNTDMVVQGDNFAGDVLPKRFGTTMLAKTTVSDGFTEIDQDTNMPLAYVTALIIDFHTQRTITGIELGNMEFSIDLTDGFCVFRVWGGSNWFLPTPKNLFALGDILNAGEKITMTEGIPEITTEKIFLTFARLKRSEDGTFVGHTDTNGNLNALGTIIIEEQIITSIESLQIFSNDFLTNSFIQIGDLSPIFRPEDEFFTHNNEYELPDFSNQINQFIQSANPLFFDDITLLDGHPEFDYLRNLSFSLLPIKIHTEMSGILTINLNLDYVRHAESFKLEEETEFTTDKKTLRFERDEQRLDSIVRKLMINLSEVGSINFITFSLEGSFSSDRIIPLVEIQPTVSSNVDSTLGFQIVTSKKAAQKIVLSKSYKLKGVDIRTKFLNKKVNYVVELRTDQNNQPSEEIIVSKEMQHDPQSTDEQPPARDFLWVQIDFDQEVELSEATYWIVLKCTAGELVWQISELTGVGMNNFLYAHEDRNSTWIPLPNSYGNEVHAVFRIRHNPSTFDDPPSLRIQLNDHVVWELAQDPQSIEIAIEEKINISDFPEGTQSVMLSFEAQSVGELNISNLLVKFKETASKKVQINGFIETLCFAGG